MAEPTPLNPFPNPVPNQDAALAAIMTRGNDNLLRRKLDEAIAYSYEISLINAMLLMGGR